MMDYKLSICMAEKRSAPKFLMDGDTQRNIGEAKRGLSTSYQHINDKIIRGAIAGAEKMGCSILEHPIEFDRRYGYYKNVRARQGTQNL